MKILVCATEYPPTGSGIGNVAYNVVEQFKKKGYIKSYKQREMIQGVPWRVVEAKRKMLLALSFLWEDYLF